ncbi:hypothetical protein ACFCZ3_11915 [Cellulosimicrobium cellulans]|uniref:hypothetical protein n=1 Tax=Cellulosimicrobium cellulans TaxID=1710 RepID=UPI0035DFB02E
MAIEVDVSTSWTDVIGALGAAGALLVAALAYAAEVRRRRRESVWGQAERVSAWIGGVPGGQASDSTLYLRNDSGAMVYDVVVHLHTGSLGAIDGAIAPGATQKYPVKYDRSVFAVVPVDVTFTDAGGRTWKRGRGGKLTPVNDA